MGIERKDGYIFFEVVNRDDEEMEYAQAYNFTRNIFGYGDDMRDWENAGDLWGAIQEMYILDMDEGKDMVGYGIVMSDNQFTSAQITTILLLT